MTEIIAEVGSNWSSFQDCKDSIAKAKACGAEVVKFQLFTAKELYGFGPNEYPDRLRGLKELLPDSWLPRDWIPKLKEKADAVGIEFMCTPFSEDGVKFLDPFVKRWKVASSDVTHFPLLDAIKATGKPVLLSVGATGLQDIKKAYGALGSCKVTLLYCSSEYPARYVDLRKMDLLRDEFPGADVGYSDHSNSVIEIPLAACCPEAYAGTVLEKHFKIREMDTPDNDHALDPNDFKLMVDSIRRKVLPTLAPIPAERDMVLRHNRRLIASKDIKQGDLLTYGENFGAFRSLVDDTSSLGPHCIFNLGDGSPGVHGRRAPKDYNQGEGIGPEVLG